MIDYRFNIYFVSSDKKQLEEYLSSEDKLFHLERNKCKFHLKDGLFWLTLVCFKETNDFNKLFKKVLSYLGDGISIKTTLIKYGFELVFELILTATNFEEDILGFTLESELMAISSYLETPFRIVINYKPKFKIDEYSYPTSGVYLYVFSSNQKIDNDKVSRVAGAKPTRTYNKGDFLHNDIEWIYSQEIPDILLRKTNDWILEYVHDHEMPERPIREMIDSIKSPDNLGLYCKENNLETKIDLTLYGIYSHRMEFTICKEFLSLCKSLNVSFLDVDIMA